MTARSFTEAFAQTAGPLDLDSIESDVRQQAYYDDELLALVAEARDLRDSRERAIRWAVTLEGQNAAMEALLTAIREQANLWRTNVLPGTHGNALECCGDALIDMFDDFPLGAALTGSTE